MGHRYVSGVYRVLAAVSDSAQTGNRCRGCGSAAPARAPSTDLHASSATGLSTAATVRSAAIHTAAADLYSALTAAGSGARGPSAKGEILPKLRSTARRDGKILSELRSSVLDRHSRK